MSTILHNAAARQSSGVWQTPVLCLCLAVAAVTAPEARADDTRYDGRGWRADVAQADPFRGNPARSVAASTSPEREAIAIYADARNDIDNGRAVQAERRLELLVARYPDAAIAELARRDLKRLYGRLPSEGAANATTELPRDAQIAAQPARRPATLPAPYALGGGELAQPLPAPPVRAAKAAVPAPQPARQESSAVPQPIAPLVLAAAEQFRSTAGDRIFFGDGSADIGGRARGALEAQASWLLRAAQATLTIEGHADDRGSPEFNSSIAERRAEAVRQRLIELGVAPERIRLVLFGRAQPVVQCSEPACSAQNRRVVTVITGLVPGAERRTGVTVAEPSRDQRPAPIGQEPIRSLPTAQRR